MVRPSTAILNGLLCFVLALVIFSPLLLHAVTMGYIPLLIAGFPVSLPKLDLLIALFMSAIVAVVITFVFYKIALKNAEAFLTKAEV